MGVEKGDRKPRVLRLPPHLAETVGPDSVLRGGPARVGRFHAPLPEPRIHPDGHGAPVPRRAQLPEHARRPDVRRDTLAQDGLEGVVPEHIGGEEDHGRLRPSGKSGAARPQHLVSAHRVDPHAGIAHHLENLVPRIRLHGVAGGRAGSQRRVRESGRGRAKEIAVVEIERRSHTRRHVFQGVTFEAPHGTGESTPQIVGASSHFCHGRGVGRSR